MANGKWSMADGRFAGGVEVVRTTGAMQGLTETLGKILQLADVPALEDAIVDCLNENLGFPRVRLYKYDAQQEAFVSRSSRGLDENRARAFAEGKIVPRKTGGEVAANFAAHVSGQPLIILREAYSNEHLPVEKASRDSRGRKVYVMRAGDERFLEELDKADVPEWLDVPLISNSELLGKLTVDPKGTMRQFGLADIELLGLFGHWAAEACAKVQTLEKAKHRAELMQGVGLLGRDRGVESFALDFLVSITLDGGPGFNRAVSFLNQPQTGYIAGFLGPSTPANSGSS
jgi:GAF domain-containing protein